jgi:hypothetical protein
MVLRHRISRRVITCGLLLVGAAIAAQAPALRYRWTKGETLRYRINQETEVVMSGLPGMGDMTVTNSMAQVYSMTVDDVAADGTATIKSKIDSVRMDMGTPMGNMTYDSTSTTAPSDPTMAMMAKMMGGMIGETLTVVMAPDGNLKSILGADVMMAKVKKNMPPDAANAGVDVDSMLGEAALRASYAQSFGILPAANVNTGESWSNVVKVPNPMGELTISRTFTLRGTETVNNRQLTKIGVAVQVKGGAGGMGPMSTQVGSGTGDGEALFDQKLGRLQRASIRQSVPMTLSMQGPDGSPITMTGVTKSTATVDLIEK